MLTIFYYIDANLSYDITYVVLSDFQLIENVLHFRIEHNAVYINNMKLFDVATL